MNPFTHRCRTCNAAPGQPCTTTAGVGMGEVTHRARRPRNAERGITRKPLSPQLGLNLDIKDQQP